MRVFHDKDSQGASFVAIGPDARQRIDKAKDLITTLINQKKFEKHTLNLKDYTANEKEIKQLESHLKHRSDELRKQLKEKFGATYYVKDGTVELSAASSKLKEAVILLNNELSQHAQKTKEDEEWIDDQGLVDFLENYEMIREIQKKVWIKIKIEKKS